MNNLARRAVRLLGLLAATVTPVAGWGGPELPSADPAAPAIRMPYWTQAALPSDIDPWVRRHVAESETARSDSRTTLLTSVALQMLSRYGEPDLSQDEQVSRLESIASGEAEDDYIASGEVSISSANAAQPDVDTTAGASGAEPATAGSAADAGARDAALVAWLSSPEGLETLSRMSGDQIGGIAALVAAMRGTPQASVPAAAAPAVPAGGVGNLPAAMGRPEVLVQGWSARRTADGAVEVVNAGFDASAIEVSEGMVLGPLGAVLRIEDGSGGVSVVLADGRRIAPASPVLSEGIPDLDGEENPPSAAAPGEFLLSALPEEPDLIADLRPQVSGGAATIVTAPRPRETQPPMPRPAGLAGPATAEPAARRPAAEPSVRPRARPAALATATAPATAPADQPAAAPLVHPLPRPASLGAPAKADETLAAFRPMPRPASLKGNR
ncbi:hypothetical protein LAZ40_11745 [Cereibacter sphaeroides]|uniref:hypothetical protein n=1 Tax=Cereibacter sphaeroides TaxID=1063 RepID=UPI001F1A66EB|nr:hypothetical protein [Cereibacter sphaeroides]MCE6959692.1 hypothetical protein [Cereibacter sphaeroides]MCE6974447.1 hypothetical protein [Cereibacter sphaeroides]